MKIVMIAALVAAQLAAAAPAKAAELQSEAAATEHSGLAEGPTRTRVEQSVSPGPGHSEAPTLLASNAPASPRAAAVQEDEPRKKGKSTGDKVLTGAAVILGIGALAVGGLLVAIFVN